MTGIERLELFQKLQELLDDVEDADLYTVVDYIEDNYEVKQ